ncbi:MAG: 50S ribosomal protein L9 [Chloroflexi bacterium]|nr:50S ribosomal protein L9 [Chloroflexota bacterium]
MKVILKEYVYMHGVAGDIVDVADGFARNFLIPQGKAVKATPAAIARHENLVAESAMRRHELNEQLVALAGKIDGTELVFGRRAERNNKLYGSVTNMDIAHNLLEVTGIDINRRRISERPIRELGEYDVQIRMGQDLAPTVKVIVVREEELDEYLARREAGEDVSDLIVEAHMVDEVEEYEMETEDEYSPFEELTGEDGE